MKDNALISLVRYFRPVTPVTRVVMPSWFAVVDVETTSLNYERGSMLSIGAVIPATGETFYGECRAWEGAHIDPESLAVNGATIERVNDSLIQTEAELVTAFLFWATMRHLKLIGGKNPSFDMGFLKAAWKRAGGARWSITHRTIDLHTLAWGWAIRHRPEALEGDGIKSDALYELMGLKPEPKPHHALVGAKVEAEAFELLLTTA